GKVRVEIDLYRRNLQRAYVDLLGANLDTPPGDSDWPALARFELDRIAKEIQTRTDAGTNLGPITRVHLVDIKTRIDHALDAIPSIPAPRPPGGRPARRGPGAGEGGAPAPAGMRADGFGAVEPPPARAAAAPPQGLRPGDPHAHGFHDADLDALRAILRRAVEDRVIPGV